ncbi:MAG: LLM class flavin-dependent oxidoreductase [Ilumatobacter sp.]|uniref:LLM class flavin-dependent oxidoreductase n=1 Tax=Ilumatobacter sp. TaxID=1967498 RepID=UPI002628D94A|nr:LLM class flavin-dependent oxidoreductase [Ilumatobacter sp.]MDJ0771202.1 LLM class flavin-dependent oxidoreductase [Ilumatobacter sp.]
MSDRLRFGIFMAPFHRAGENPTLAIERDLELVEHLDKLGWDEAWIGEHHSAGSEIIASPEIFIAAAAERTKHIKLGTGVISVAYHNPYMIAERAVQLDHMTRGRFMLGLGPGSLPTDAVMLGLDPTETRPLLEEGLEVIMQLLTSDEPVTSQTKMWNLTDARLHLRPYSNPLFDVAVPAVASPTGPRLAGKHGIGLLSIGATQSEGFDVLGLHWDVMEERAAKFGTAADRSKWRLVGLMHIAETREQAYRDVEHGIVQWFDYFQHTAAFPQMAVGDSDAVRGAIDFVNESGLGSIGTPDDAIEQIERLQKQSGGFGCYMTLAHEWANPAATHRSYELIAQEVFPRLQGHAASTLDAKGRARAAREHLAERNMQAVTDMIEKHEAELSESG